MIVWGDLIDITGCVNRDNKWPGDCFPPGFVFKDQEIFQYFALLWIDKREKWEPGLETAQFSFCVTTDEKYSIFASNPLIKKKKRQIIECTCPLVISSLFHGRQHGRIESIRETKIRISF